MISLDVTERCNLRCHHCRSHLGTYQPTTPALLHLVSEIAKFKPRIVVLSGGEPLLRDDIFEVVEAVRHVGASVQLNTNGILVDQELARRIGKAGIEYVQVSIEGPKAIHEAIRGKGTWVRTVEACRYVSEETQLILNTTVSRYNIVYLEETAELLFGRNPLFDLHMWGLKRFVPNNNLGREHALGPGGLSHLVHLWQGLRARYPWAIIKTDVPQTNLLDVDRTRRLMEKHAIGCAGCSAGVEALTIRADGTVAPCPTLYVDCGNLHDEPVEQILHHPILAGLRQRAFDSTCGDCNVRDLCGGCRALAFTRTGDVFGADPECYGSTPHRLPILASRRSDEDSGSDVLSVPRRREGGGS